MTNQTPTEQPINKLAVGQTLPSPLRCLLGSAIAGVIAFGSYSLTSSIAQAFAAKPVVSNNPLVLNITVAVRTLVVGVAALGTGIFSLVAVGLVALAVQSLIKQLKKSPDIQA